MSQSEVVRTLDVNPAPVPKRPRAGALVLGATGLVWIFELAAGLVVASPVHAWAHAYFGAHPDGDAAIWRPGGHALLSWLLDTTPSLAIVARTTLVLFVVSGLAGRFVFGLTVAWLSGRGRKSFRDAGSSWALLVITGALAFACELFLVAVGALAAGAADSACEARLGDARSLWVGASVYAIFAALLAIVHVASDLVDVAVATGDRASSALARLRVGIVHGAGSLRVPHVLGWAVRFALGAALVVAGARLADATGERAGATLVVVFVAHQALVCGRALLRVSWLESARRAVQRSAL
jgi:hypothetical protein